MRRTLSVVTVALVALAGCGDGVTTKSATASTDNAETAASAVTDPTAEPDVAPPVTVLAIDPASFAKPTVKTPAAIPTELVVTVLEPGDGPLAESGDTVDVHYVGVLSSDGSEFDNSYDRGQTFPVTLGAGGVISGWDQGLVGAQAGSQIQLDIPSDLAYGPAGKGDIGPDEALTFVIDVVSVTPGLDIPIAEPDDEPTVSVPLSDGVSAVETEDLVVGDGDPIVEGDTVYAQIIAYNGASGEKLQSTWADGGSPTQLFMDASQTLPGLVEGMLGMNSGGRRLITIPYLKAFGEAGNESFGLPAQTDLIVLIEVVLVD